jgi:hypothetical protein
MTSRVVVSIADAISTETSGLRQDILPFEFARTVRFQKSRQVRLDVYGVMYEC